MNITDKELLCKDCAFSYMKGIFSEDDYCSIEQNRSEISFSKDDILIKQGSFVSQVFYIKSGIVKIVLEGKHNRETILKIIDAKNFIALPVLEKSDVYPFSVIALTECSICVIRRETLQSVIHKNEKANNFIRNCYSNDFLYLYNRISILGTRNNHGKLASTLLYLSNGEFSCNILEHISRKDLSQLASISLESTNKILAELKNDKIIRIENNSIVIQEPELIKKLSLVG